MNAVITCPKWCQTKHTPEDKWGVSSELHEKHFGKGGSEGQVIAWAVIETGGLITSSGFDIDVDTATDPQDMDEVAAWCTAAAAFMHEIRGAMVTA